MRPLTFKANNITPNELMIIVVSLELTNYPITFLDEVNLISGIRAKGS